MERKTKPRSKLLKKDNGHLVFKPSKKFDEKIKNLLKAGFNTNEIGKMFDVSGKTIQRHYGDLIREYKSNLLADALTELHVLVKTPGEHQMQAIKTAIHTCTVVSNFGENINHGKGNTIININTNEQTVAKLQEELNKETINLEANEEGIYHEVDDDGNSTH